MAQKLAAVAAPGGGLYDDPNIVSSDRGNALKMQRMDSVESNDYEKPNEVTTGLLNSNAIKALQVGVSFLVLWRVVSKYPEMNVCVS